MLRLTCERAQVEDGHHIMVSLLHTQGQVHCDLWGGEMGGLARKDTCMMYCCPLLYSPVYVFVYIAISLSLA